MQQTPFSDREVDLSTWAGRPPMEVRLAREVQEARRLLWAVLADVEDDGVTVTNETLARIWTYLGAKRGRRE